MIIEVPAFMMMKGTLASVASGAIASAFGVKITPAEIPIAVFTHDDRWILGYVYNGTQRELTLYVTPAAPVLAGKATALARNLGVLFGLEYWLIPFAVLGAWRWRGCPWRNIPTWCRRPSRSPRAIRAPAHGR